MYLLFLNTGFLVGLPDEPGILLDDTTVPRFVLRDTDAAGLGLVPEDLSAGVVVCRSEGSTGWSCDPVSLVEEEAYAILAPPRPSVFDSSTESNNTATSRMELGMPRQPRILVFVSPDHLHDGCLERAAEIAGAHDAVVLLAAVGEVPETALHAAEERDALVRMLGRAAHAFGERVGGTCIEMGGDPVHGLAELVAESRPDVVVLPHETHRPPGGTDLAQALGRHMDIPVLQVTRDSSGGRHPRPGALDRGALRGGPKMALDCGWVELIPVDERHSVGRAHLFLNGMPVHLEPWCGHLDSLRPAVGVAEVRPGRYILRFASGLQNIPADVDVADGRINVCGHYHDVPASLAELSEGE